MKSGNPKQRIITKASKLFYEQGYVNTGINQIIREADVAKTTFYHHFASKEMLCLEYLKRRRKFAIQVLKHITEEKPDIKDSILALFLYIEQTSIANDYRGCPFIIIISELPGKNDNIRAEVKGYKKDIMDLIRSILASVNQYNDTKLSLLTESIFVLFEGALISCACLQSPQPAKTAATAAIELLEKHNV